MARSVRGYRYARCSTCRKALAWLEDQQIAYELFDIVEAPPSKHVLREAFDQLGSRKPLFNTSGLSYRALGSAAVKAMSDDEALDALAGDGKLIKRPFLITGSGKVLVGFKPDVWTESLLN